MQKWLASTTCIMEGSGGANQGNHYLKIFNQKTKKNYGY